MSTTARDHNRIDLNVAGRYDEALCTVAVSPGMLLQWDGATGKLKPHATQGAPATGGPIMVAGMDALQGKSVDDVIAIGALVPFWIPKPGDEFAMLLNAAEVATLHCGLVSAGDGSLEVVTHSAQVLFISLEALDLTGKAATLVKVQYVGS